jgi:signal transduction histidine kinase
MSLLGYLSRRLLLLSLNVSAGIFYLVYILYQWGLDDSTEFYLEQDMQWAKEILATEPQQGLPKNTEFKQFYLSDSSLPQQYKNQILANTNINTSTSTNTQSFFLQDEDHYHYGLYERLEDNTSLTVIHKFSVESSAEGMSLFEVSMLASLLLTIMMLIGAWLIYQRIARSMEFLLSAVSSESSGNATELAALPKPDFIEIENIVNALQEALNNLDNKNEQERLFIQTLSHELRTPMATIQVALELLLKKEVLKKELSENVREKIAIIFNSNKQMQHLSHQLLTLWTETKVEDKTEIDIEQQLLETINELDQAFDCQQRFIIKPLDNTNERLTAIGSVANVKLLLNNLCKNAIVHSDGPIQITLAAEQLTISNAKDASVERTVDPLVAGSGIGLIIATRAAEQLGWELTRQETEIEYQLRVVFN